MELSQGVLRLTAVAMLLGIILPLIPEGTEKSLVKLVGSLLLTMTAVAALTDLRLPELDALRREFQADGAQAAALGQELAQEERLGRIKHLLESYILDKAAALEAELDADLTLDDQGLPESVALRGRWSEYAKQRLGEMITEELGLPKEKQQWILGN